MTNNTIRINTKQEPLFTVIDGTNSLGMNYLALVRERNLRQLSQREMRRIFEEICDSDFKTVRLFMR